MESRLGQLAVDILFPRFCLRCGREGEVWCRNCEESYRPRVALAACSFCGRVGADRTCLHCRPAAFLDGCQALTNYGDPVVRKAITLWKYHGDRAAEETLRRWVWQAANSLRMDGPPEAITFVPLHANRKRARGFDQAEEVANWLGALLGRPVRKLLVRRRATAARAAVAHDRRHLGEMDGIFAATGEVPSTCLICDDVFTSGATLDAGARALKEAGAATVWGFTLARG